MTVTDPKKANLRRRNLATLGVIVAFIALLYLVGIVRMKGL